MNLIREKYRHTYVEHTEITARTEKKWLEQIKAQLSTKKKRRTNRKRETADKDIFKPNRSQQSPTQNWANDTETRSVFVKYAFQFMLRHHASSFCALRLC